MHLFSAPILSESILHDSSSRRADSIFSWRFCCAVRLIDFSMNCEMVPFSCCRKKRIRSELWKNSTTDLDRYRPGSSLAFSQLAGEFRFVLKVRQFVQVDRFQCNTREDRSRPRDTFWRVWNSRVRHVLAFLQRRHTEPKKKLKKKSKKNQRKFPIK